MDMVRDEASLAEPLSGAPTYLAAEVRYAVLYEAALHVDDVLTSRTHIAFEAPDRGREAVEHIARLMAPALGWDQVMIDREVAHYRARLDAESAAQAMLDDAARRRGARAGQGREARGRVAGGQAGGGTSTYLPTCRFSRNSVCASAIRSSGNVVATTGRSSPASM